MLNRKQIILEATAKHLRHAMQGLRDILAKGADLDELKSQSAYEHPFTHGGFSSREMQDASSEDHAHLLRYLFGKPVSYMPSTHLKPQTFNINKIREIQGPLPAGNRYSHLGNVWEPKPRSVVWHSITRAQNQIARSINRLMAKHPGHDHPDAPIFNAQINSHSQTWEKLEAAKEKMRFGALSDVGHPLDDQFYHNYETHGPAVRAQLQDVKATIRDSAKLFGRKAVKPEPKALPPGSEQQKTQNESVRIAKIDAVLTEIVKKEGKQWVVRSEKGKNLGKFSSEAAAKNRLRQVEYFKRAKK